MPPPAKQNMTVEEIVAFVNELLWRVAELERQLAALEGRIAPDPLTLPYFRR